MRPQRINLFDYDPSRGGEGADTLIEGCSGYLQSDGYQAYEGATERAGLIHVGCFAHARRRFFEALKALPNAQRTGAGAAHVAVRRIDALHLIERRIKDVSDEERTPDPSDRSGTATRVATRVGKTDAARDDALGQTR